jgi:hypothetical protein
MPSAVESILAQLKIVDTQRERRSAVPGLSVKVDALKAYQQRRFAHTYADLLLTTRYGAAARFFLDELYGPSDFTQRDAQFARVVPALVRLFPREIVEAVAALAELHALSETLDTAMATNLKQMPINAPDYVQAWRQTDHAPERQLQIALTLSVAQRLDRLTRKPLLRQSLRLMRGPARAAGLADLQHFLETGFDTFQAMKGAQDFVALIESRELALVSSLNAPSAGSADPVLDAERAFASLPK